MDKARRNRIHAQIRAENIAANMQHVGENSFVELFDHGYDLLVLFDLKTDVHPAMQDLLLPGLRRAKNEFEKAYRKVLLHGQGARVAFAHIDHHAQERRVNLPDDPRVIKLIHERVKRLQSRRDDLYGYKMGRVDFVSAKKGFHEALYIQDVTDHVQGIRTLNDFISSLENPFHDEVTYVHGPWAESILARIEQLGVTLPHKKDVDFSLRHTPH